MPRRQILSSEEQERLLVIPDDEIILTRMCFLNEPDIALINKHRRPANRPGFAVLLCYLRGLGFIPDKSSAPHNGVVSVVASRLKLQPDLWPEYASREQTCWEHLTELYRYRNYPRSAGQCKRLYPPSAPPMPCELTKDLCWRKKCSAGYITIMLFSLLLK